MKRKIWLVLALVMVLSALVGCGGKPAPTPSGDATSDQGKAPAPAPANEEAGKTDGVLDVVHASEPDSIDPALNTSVDGAIMLQHAFEGLVKWVDDGNGMAKLAPGMAESWDVSEDGLEWTFHLRDGIKWSDGKPVTAADFKFSWDRLVDIKTAADYEYMLDMVKGYNEIREEDEKVGKGELKEEERTAKLAIEAVDEKTFKVTLNNRCPYFEEICAFPATFPVREDMVKNEKWTFEPATYISNGPYTMKSWEHNSKITFVKNPEYYGAADITAETIVFHLMDDANAMLAGYRSGELDLITEVPQDEIPGLLSSGELKTKPYVGTYFVCFNTQKAPFDDPKVREAFSLAIDRNFIVSQVTGRGEVPATGFVPAGVYDAKGSAGDDFRTVGGGFYSINDADYKANCDKARELLKEAGYEGGKGFPVVEYLYNTNDNHRAIGEALQNMWQTELGVTVNLQNQDWAVFLQERKNGNFSIARHGWIADYNDPMTFIDMWMTGGGNNDAQYNNPEFDNLLKDAKKEADPEKRMELLHKAENLAIKEDKIVAPLYFYVNPYMIKPNVEGVYYTPLGYFFYGYTKGF